ncbi:MAG: EAL domain-containing protein, partial [Hyphomicrobiales bacterium]|nr:EAL domain-containing protein [Hyphomicrobiales bacterium]
AVINMGRDLGVSVIAEGVETLRQLEGLKALGCQAAQGFFLGEPRAIDDWIAASETPGDEPAPLAAPSDAEADTRRFGDHRASSS